MIPESESAAHSRQTAAPHGIDRLLLKSPDPYPGAEYLPLATLLLPALGSTIHGSVADWQRLLLLGFTLHHLIQFMRCPSGLIRASHVPAAPIHSEIPPTANWALVELRIIKISAILVLLASPFLAVGFLRAVQSAMRPGEPLVDRFATRLCFIAVAVRPCAYLFNIFRPHRSQAPSHFPTAAEELKVRSQALEKALIGREAVAATTSDLNELRDRIKDPIADLRRALDTLARHRKSSIPATTSAQQALSKTTGQLAQRTQNLVDLVKQRVALADQRRSSTSAVLLARTNDFITSTGTTLQRLGTTLAPPQANTQYH
ncbi:uncharacterized protein PGTG_07142 [Puccinia graminis f. sp. tritici CRL 75-36-700-3]|uniref:Uncharacterized protein n=1 Tax=Puccinia graminis f. sp. tritici (strain CRL 75-36-700-3 / race SCCL) TaxID=418459 RepID=E3K9G5_PUCGT|nr:uncharacterized protein PGTG_07142 [Puccinia graminis f. sp. tritici CRL 75-36-700-3]EFP80890.2 hypothetical protein PGTG_07142 [Puccinia graminis f. sp. tritici CRL 75-36-700-3]